MEKNENGIPIRRPSPQNAREKGTDGVQMNTEGTKDKSTKLADDGQSAESMPQKNNGTAKDMHNGACSELGGVLPTGDVSLAYVYAPKQSFCMLYSDSDALTHGTLFEQLYKPMEVYPR